MTESVRSGVQEGATRPPRAPSELSTIEAAWEKALMPPFVTKLRAMVDDPTTNDLISWRDDGLSFQVHLPSEFAKTVLPRYFKHSNFTSFARQLNQYGFRKLDSDHFIFGNRYFVRDHPEWLSKVTRRRPSRTLVRKEASPPPTTAALEIGNYGFGTDASASVPDLDMLRRDKKLLLQELLASRQRQIELERKLRYSEQRIQQLESSVEQMKQFIYQSFQLLLQQHGIRLDERKRKRLTNVSAEPVSSSAGLSIGSIEYKGDTGELMSDGVAGSPPASQSLVLRQAHPESIELIRNLMAQLQMANMALRNSANPIVAEVHPESGAERDTFSVSAVPSGLSGASASELARHQLEGDHDGALEAGTRTRSKGPSILLLDDENGPTSMNDTPADEQMDAGSGALEEDFDLSQYVNVEDLLDVAGAGPMPLPPGQDADLLAEEVRRLLEDEPD
ncbi:hypothetical protein CCYA_CCYA16G4211 [Cyanidiococcus yangmingshanensis]|nr:hypothetical protein CCYA_CCYA16G4211 [Cyanidiococcus yangmingshanensis]